MLAKQPPQLPGADAEPVGKPFDIVIIEPTGLDQGKCAGHGVGRSPPEGEVRRGLRPTAQAWTETSLLRRSRGRKERYVLEFRRARRADRPAIDAGGLDAHEQPSVEPRVAGRDRAVTGDAVHIHHGMIIHSSRLVSRFSDIVILAGKTGASDQISKIRHVVVPWASRRPLPSVSRPSAVPTRRPRLSTTPSALISPVSGVIGRTREILNSSVV